MPQQDEDSESGAEGLAVSLPVVNGDADQSTAEEAGLAQPVGTDLLGLDWQ